MFTDEEIRQGRRRMKRLLPKARAEARKLLFEDGLRPGNLLSQNLLDAIEERHLDALVIRRRRSSDWYADILFRKLPAGLPTVIGTPEAVPLASEAEAKSHGAAMLSAIMKSIEERRIGSRDVTCAPSRFFDLHGFEFPFPVPLIEALAAAIATQEDAVPGAIEETMARLDARLEGMMGGEGFDEALWEEGDDGERTRVLADMALLLAMGVFRHPTAGRGDSRCDA